MDPFVLRTKRNTHTHTITHTHTHTQAIRTKWNTI